MEDNSTNPFYEPSERKFRRSSNGRSFFDDGPEPEPSNPFYNDMKPPRPGIYKRGGYNQTNGNSNRSELFGGPSEQKHSNLFDEDEDDFDVDAPFDAEAYRQKLLLRKIRESANRQMDSQQRSLAVIEDSEQMGVTTAETPRAYSVGPLAHLTGGPVFVARRTERRHSYDPDSDSEEDDEELLHQREQLDNVERKTHEINKTMDVSTKHVDKLSSLFGGLKGWFRKKEEPAPEPTIPERDSKLRDTVEAYKVGAPDKSQHPAVRIRDSDLAQQSKTKAPGEEKVTSRQLFTQYDDEFNKNLDMMSAGISRLKGLGLVLQTEIESQNDQIERINENVIKVDDKVVQQTKRIKKQLEK